MAKKKVDTGSVRVGGSYVPTYANRDIKERGQKYKLEKAFLFPGKLMVNAGGSLSECVDGYFQVYNESGVALSFRIGPQYLETLRSTNAIK